MALPSPGSEKNEVRERACGPGVDAVLVLLPRPMLAGEVITLRWCGRDGVPPVTAVPAESDPALRVAVPPIFRVDCLLAGEESGSMFDSDGSAALCWGAQGGRRTTVNPAVIAPAHTKPRA